MTSLRFDRALLGFLGVSGVFAAMSACSASNVAPPRGHAGSTGTPGVGGTGNPGAGGTGTPGAGGTGTPGAGGTGNPGAGGTGNPGAGGTGTAGVGPAAGGTGTAGSGTAGTGVAGTTTAGAGGSGPTLPLCTTKITAASTQIANFEDYDGMMDPTQYGFSFGGPTNGTLGVRSGFYAYGGDSTLTPPAAPTLMIGGGHASNWALTEALTQTAVSSSSYGEGMGFLILDPTNGYKAGCVDASAYAGITMYVRGSVPTGVFSFSLSLAESTETANLGSCTGTDAAKTCAAPTESNIPVTADWTAVNVLWADLMGGLSGPAMPITVTGSDITSFSFGAGLQFVPEADGSATYIAAPGSISLSIDDLAFIPK